MNNKQQISAALIFIGALLITTCMTIAFLVVWVVAYIGCWAIFMLTGVTGIGNQIDWHPDTQLEGCEPKVWTTLITNSFSYWDNVISVRVKNILK